MCGISNGLSSHDKNYERACRRFAIIVMMADIDPTFGTHIVVGMVADPHDLHERNTRKLESVRHFSGAVPTSRASPPASRR